MSQGKFKLFQREVTSCCDGSLEAINRTNCSFICMVKECVHLTDSLGISKTMALATKSH